MARQQLINKITKTKEAFRAFSESPDSNLTQHQREYIDKAVNVFNQLDSNTPSESEDELIVQARNQLRPLLDADEQTQPSYNDQTLANWAYQGMKAIAKYAPLNNDCPISLEKVNEDEAFYSKEGHKFDIESLRQWIQVSYKNPANNTLFHKMEINDFNKRLKLRALITDGLLSYEQTLDLSEQQINNLKSFSIRQLIEHDKLSIDEAIGLEYQEKSNIADPDIKELIIRNKLTVDEARDLSEQEKNNLCSENILQLIYYDRITSKNARDLTEEKRQWIDYRPINVLILKNKLSLNQAEALIESNRINTVRIYEIFYLLINDKLSGQQVQGLSDQKIDRLRSSYPLIFNGYLRANRALEFNEKQRNIFESCSIQELIVKDKLNIDKAEGLEYQEKSNITDPDIKALIIKDKLDVDRARGLQSPEKENLQHFSIRQLIEHDKLSIDEAIGLGYQEKSNIADPDIKELIIKNKLDVNRAKSLQPPEKENLQCFSIRQLIKRDKLSIDEAIGLTEQQCATLNCITTSSLISRYNLRVDQVKNLTPDQSEKLKRLFQSNKLDDNNSQDLDEQKIIKLISPGPYHLIDEGALKVNQATNLDKAQIKNLGVDKIKTLFSNNKLSLDKVRELTGQEINKLVSPGPYRLINEDALNVDQATKLDKAQIENLGVDEIGTLFSKSKLSLDEVRDLTGQQIENLKQFVNNQQTQKRYSYPPTLYQLIIQNKLNAEQANKLTQIKTNPFGLGVICELISNGTLEVKNAINLDNNIIDKLETPAINELMNAKKLVFDELEHLTDNQKNRLVIPGIRMLIKTAQLKVSDVDDLQDYQVDTLINAGVRALIERQKVSWNDIRHLDLSQFKRNILCKSEIEDEANHKLIPLFTEDKLTLADFNELTDEQASLLQQQDIRQSLCDNVIKIGDLKSLDDRQVTNLSPQYITKLLYDGKLDLETAKDLADDELVEFAEKGTIQMMLKQKDEKNKISSEDVLARAHIKRAIRSQALENVLQNFLDENNQNKHMYLTPSSRKKKQHISNRFDHFTKYKQGKNTPVVDYKYDIVNSFFNIIEKMADKRYASGYGWTKTLENFYNKIEGEIPADQKRDFSNDLVLIKSQLDYLRQNPDCLKELRGQFNPNQPSPIVSIELNHERLCDVFNRKDRNKDLQSRYAKEIIEAISSTTFQNLLREFKNDHLSNTPSNNQNLPSATSCSFFSHQSVGSENQQVPPNIDTLLQRIQTDQTLSYTENGQPEISNDTLKIVDQFWDVIEAMANSDNGDHNQIALDEFYQKLNGKIDEIMDDPDSSKLHTIKEQLNKLRDNPKDTSQSFAASNNKSDRIQRLKQQTYILRDQDESPEHEGPSAACVP